MKSLFRLFVLGLFAMLGLASPAFAAVTWDLTGVTGELSGLSTAVIAAIGIAITAGIAIFGVKRAIGVVTGVISKLMGR